MPTLYNIPRPLRQLLIAALHGLLVALSLYLAYVLRFDFRLPQRYLQQMLQLLPWVLLIKLLVFACCRQFQGWWRYVSLVDMLQVVRANVLASLAVVTGVFFLWRLEGVPRSVLLLDGLLCLGLTTGARLGVRAWREGYGRLPQLHAGAGRRTLIVGAGEAGQLLLRELRRQQDRPWQVVGLVDDDAAKQGAAFQGVPVRGRIADLPLLCRRLRIVEVLIAVPSASGEEVRRMVALCQQARVRYKILPGVSELLTDARCLQQIKDVSLEDLLGREPVALQTAQIRELLQQQVVFITGAGGSIGSELARQAARFAPQTLVLLDQAETGLFWIQQQLQRLFPELPVVPCLGDIRDTHRIQQLLQQYQPSLILHAAAYKHVPLSASNQLEVWRNNLLGTQVLAQAALEQQIPRLVMVSTDKAVAPSNPMGASKRACELLLQSLAGQGTRFMMVRFGNVLGSSGSVVPIFQQQIEAGGPVTVSHPEASRYFMTLSEAAQLILQAGSLGQDQTIYLLEMGQPLRIRHLAADMIRLAGFRPEQDIEIRYTGLRPGEKLHESLLRPQEQRRATSHAKIFSAHEPGLSAHAAAQRLAPWLELVQQPQLDAKQLPLDVG